MYGGSGTSSLHYTGIARKLRGVFSRAELYLHSLGGGQRGWEFA